MFKNWLRALGKLDYVQGKERPDVECILCAVRDNDDRVRILKIYQDDILFVCLNLYPYNPGHLLIVPIRHVKRYINLTRIEVMRISRAIQGLQHLLDDLYNPKGYNIGMNEGRIAGGSIEHLHFHLVPRYGEELGYIDIVGKTRIVVESLESVKKKLAHRIDTYLNEDFFSEF
ncbi:MAG: HIT domain-containing protein [Promethearchaeota archaeon]|nr:MAG: HIT domain-containing protein [Candidatus Lokiarchaeota archaeon]